MKLETMIERLANAQKNLEKLNKKLERIQKAEASNWEDNPYWYRESDKEQCIKDIASTTNKINNLQESIKEAQSQEDSRNIPALVEFLERWKENFISYKLAVYDKASEMRANVRQLAKESRISNGDMEAYEAFYNADKAYQKALKRQFATCARYLMMCSCRASAVKEIEADAKQEAEAKYNDIINRTKEKVGTITDASALRIGIDGELNGLIYGTDGAVRVETIGAGGWNIQRFHFRTLLHDIPNEK